VHFIHQAATLIEPYIAAYGLLAIFVIIYLESFGVPLPGESAVVAASVMALRGDFAIYHLLAVVWVAAVAGDCTGYAIGKAGGRPLLQRYGPLVHLTPARLERFEDMFRRRGAWIVLGARFVVLLRQLNGLIAGSVAMPWRSFLLANAAGGLLWSAAWTLGPYFFGSHLGLGRLVGLP